MAQAFRIASDIPGRLRIRYGKYAFTFQEACALEIMFSQWDMVKQVQTNDITGSVLLIYDSLFKEELFKKLKLFDLKDFHYENYQEDIKKHEYIFQQKQAARDFSKNLIGLVSRKVIGSLLLPQSILSVLRFQKALPYFHKGFKSLVHRHINVSVLDATSIGVSMLNRQFQTAGNIIFLLAISDLLQDYTKKKTSLQLKESLSLQIDQVWILKDQKEVLISANQLQKDDILIVRMGSMIPVDGEVIDGEALINESSFTGEPLSKEVRKGQTVFAGTVVEEGYIHVQVRQLQSESRISKIVDMIDTNETLKANIQSQAENLADSIVPYSFLSFFVLLIMTRNLSQATSVLLVDYSCAIKLTTSISIISAMQEASRHSITVKGGKYLEAMAHSDTIVFDKTGTLTNASPQVQNIYAFAPYSPQEVLKISACLEEHFPHSVANAIVKKAQEEKLHHEEEHAKVEYIIAHGIATTLYEQRAIIGSEHFVFEDEHVPRPQDLDNILASLQKEGAHSLIFLAIGQKLVGILSIYDPLKEEACEVIAQLRQSGYQKIVMLTGDGHHAAKHIAEQLHIQDFQAEVLPEDKAAYIKALKQQGHCVVMVGDGVNDTPALSSADVSISMQNSSDIARELADITLTSSNLNEIVELRHISTALMQRIHTNYQQIVIFNSSLILGGLFGIIPPSCSAFLHNASTVLLSTLSTRPFLKK